MSAAFGLRAFYPGQTRGCSGIYAVGALLFPCPGGDSRQQQLRCQPPSCFWSLFTAPNPCFTLLSCPIFAGTIAYFAVHPEEMHMLGGDNMQVRWRASHWDASQVAQVAQVCRGAG